ncbi:MAG TPA: HD domain-containing protein, partial [Phycisphaerae bacterium]|nr:HD domain-containing protein [Phycisphaerae bacterium]
VVTTHIGSLLTDRIDWPVLTIDEASLGPVAEIFGRLVDLASPWTAVHSAGVTATAAALARLMHFSPREQQLMRAAGYLHDIGKLSVPSAILDKPGKLTREEFLVVKAHTYHTYHILEAIGGLTQVSEWAAFHHERLDGRGYPFHLGDDELTLGSRIMAVADVLTAITEDRPYRKGMDRAEAMSVINKLVDKGGLDGQVVRVLEAHYDEIVDERQLVQAEYGAMQSILTNIVQGPADAHQSVLAGVGNAIT